MALSYKLFYLLEFNDSVGVFNRTEIYKYADLPVIPIQLEGAEEPVTFEAPDATDVLQPLNGSSLTLRLIATSDFTLSDLFGEDETEYKVIHKRNGEAIFTGFIIPDGAHQDFVHDVWEVQLDCVDGLGLLKNKGFVVDGTGDRFTGKMSMLDVIKFCLLRTRLEMPINTSVNVFYDGLLTNPSINPTFIDPLANAYINVERFYKDDGETPMTCDEVLKSVLDEFRACIRQRRGEWYIIKLNELALNTTTTFKRYTYLGVRNGESSINLNQIIGADIGGYLPHHAFENQQLWVERAYKKLTINYKFGVVTSISQNGNFTEWSSDTQPVGWTKVGGVSVNRDSEGARITSVFNANQYIESDGIPVGAGDDLGFRIGWRLGSNPPDYKTYTFMIYVGGWSLQRTPNSGELSWVNSLQRIRVITTARSYIIEGGLPPLPVAGTLKYRLYANEESYFLVWKEASFLLPEQNNLDIKGEFHTVTQTGNYSTVPDNVVVYNGDGVSSIYVGTIYKNDQTTPTSAWFRFQRPPESKPLLQIAAEDTLRMFQRPRQKFTGGFFGFFDYLSVVEIVGLTGRFIPTGMVFNFKSNSGDVTLKEIIGTELEGITYELSDDYGNAIKPVIR